jgi:hypothetical protein
MAEIVDFAVEQDRLNVTPDRRVARADASRKIFRREPKTMCEWAAKGWGPKPIMVGGRVFYDVGEKPVKPAIAA